MIKKDAEYESRNIVNHIWKFYIYIYIYIHICIYIYIYKKKYIHVCDQKKHDPAEMEKFVRKLQPPENVERPGKVRPQSAPPKAKGRANRHEEAGDQRIDLSAVPKGKPRGAAATIQKLADQVERLKSLVETGESPSVSPRPEAAVREEAAASVSPEIVSEWHQHAEKVRNPQRYAEAQALRMQDPDLRRRSAEGGRLALESPELRKACVASGSAGGPAGGPSGDLGAQAGALVSVELQFENKVAMFAEFFFFFAFGERGERGLWPHRAKRGHASGASGASGRRVTGAGDLTN